MKKAKTAKKEEMPPHFFRKVRGHGLGIIQ